MFSLFQITKVYACIEIWKSFVLTIGFITSSRAALRIFVVVCTYVLHMTNTTERFTALNSRPVKAIHIVIVIKTAEVDESMLAPDPKGQHCCGRYISATNPQRSAENWRVEAFH